MQKFDVAIIGAGPSGIACAVQLKRYGVDFVIFEQDNVGGLAKNANLIENYPGFPDGIKGIELVKLFKQQLEKNNIGIRHEKVLNIDYKEDIFNIKTENETINSRIVVIASGTKPKKPENLVISEELKDKVFYDVYSIRNIKDKEVAIVGSGDGAFDYALTLSKNNRVKILNKTDKAKALPLLIDRCSKNSNISYLTNTEILQVKENGEKILIISNNGEFKVDSLCFAIGREPNLDFMANFDKEQNNPFLYKIGDVQNGNYRQISISVGDGVKTASQIYEFLMRKI